MADVKVDALHQPFPPRTIPEETPAVLSLGGQMYGTGGIASFPADGRPYFIRPDMGVIELNVDGRVPVIDSSCRVLNSGQFKKDCDLLRLFVMVSARAEGAEAEGVDEGVAQDSETDYIRSRKASDLELEACSKSHEFCHYPKSPFCKVCQKARMMAPPRKEEGRAEEIGHQKVLGITLLLTTRLLKLMWKKASKVKQSFCRTRTKLEQFTPTIQENSSLVTDTKHQQSMWDSSKSLVEREIRHMLEGTRTNLVQSGLPLQYWPMAMQHFSMAVNATPQLNGDDAPWKLRFDENFPCQLIPFGAKILFWNNPKRIDNTSGKTSPAANDRIFLGYHVQPCFAMEG